jgi:O-antigen/teichoic acid export membrane protein
MSQLLNVGGNLVLTPFIIHGLGIERYGLYMLALSFIGIFGGLDGGVSGTAGRYFAVYAATDDRRSTTRLLVTSCLAVCAFGLLLSVVIWFLAPLVVSVLSMSSSLRGQAVFLLRTFGILALTSFVHSLFQQVINSRQRWAWSSQSSVAVYALYIVGFIIVVHTGAGLRGVALVFVGQQILASALIIPAALRYLDRHSVGLLSWPELRTVASFSGKVQVGNMASLVNSEVDPLVIGGGLSIRAMGIYSPGANFASQLFSVALNALGPAGVYLANIFGRDGEEGAFKAFVRFQKIWVTIVTGWSAVAMGAVYFGISVWLGPRFHIAGWICIVLTAGNGVLLMTLLVSSYATVVGKAGVAARYGVVGMVVNLALTVPLVLLGSLGVVAATAAGEVVAAGYLLHIARRSVRADIPNPLRDVPVLRGVVACAATAALEMVLQPHVPSGAVGLVAMGMPAVAGLILFAVLSVGPGRVARHLVRPRQTIARLREQISPGHLVSAQEAGAGSI